MTMIVNGNLIPSHVEQAIKIFAYETLQKPPETIDVQDILTWLIFREGARLTAEKEIEDALMKLDNAQDDGTPY